MSALGLSAEALAERKFMTEQNWEPEPNSGCWLWMGALTPRGYGYLYIRHGWREYAHRFSYKLHRGPIPAGLVIDHLCRVPCCVNPNHLEAVTIGENVLRGISPPALYARSTHCRKGHPLPPDRGECQSCKRARRRAFFERTGR